MDHVDAQECVATINRPVRKSSVNGKGFADVFEARFLATGSDRDERVGMNIAWLPFKLGEAPREIDHMFARPASELNHESPRRTPFAYTLAHMFPLAKPPHNTHTAR